MLAVGRLKQDRLWSLSWYPRGQLPSIGFGDFFFDGFALFDDEDFVVAAFGAVDADHQIAVARRHPRFAPLVLFRAFQVGLAEVGVVVWVRVVEADDFEDLLLARWLRRLVDLRR